MLTCMYMVGSLILNSVMCSWYVMSYSCERAGWFIGTPARRDMHVCYLHKDFHIHVWCLLLFRF